MSKDIRSFFKSTKPSKLAIIEDDDDVIPESPDVQIKNKKKESRKKRCLSDSDDETFTSKKKKPIPSPASKSSKKKKVPEKPALKEVKVADLFGRGPVKRTEPLVKKAKKKTETGIHSDEEFEKSLLEVDITEEEELSKTEAKKEKPAAQNHSNIKSEKVDMVIIKSPKKLNGDCNNQEIRKEQPSKEIKQSSSSYSQSNNTKSKTDSESPRKSRKDISSSQNEKDKTIKLNESKVIKESKAENGKERKRDFSEFLDSDVSVVENCDDDKHKKKRTKMDKSLNESALTDEEKHERKMYSAALYKSYLNRSGPKHLGAKVIPEGARNCLANCAFVLTGVLDSFERDEITEAIAKYGGCVKNGISKKVTHLLAGDDAGPAKMAKAEELGIIILNEDDFLNMIKDSVKKSNHSKDVKKESSKEKSPSRKSPRKNSHDRHKKDSKEKIDEQNAKDKERKSEKTDVKNHARNKNVEKSNSQRNQNTKIKVEVIPEKKMDEVKSKKSKDEVKSTKSKDEVKSSEINKDEEKTELKSSDPTEQKDNGLTSQITKTPSLVSSNATMWVDKYKPQNVKQIIGQHGDASNVKKLMNWLTKWYVNRKAKLPKPSPWAKKDDGGFYKAALLSGPPGVGKTTTVSLVCKELGFDAVEFNASDTRNRTLIKQQIGELLTTTSLSSYAKGDTGKQAVTKKHVLVMDEVDGMAGNEDRGGLQELIGLIKSTSVPIICMCNDRASQKMRSLVNYCYDLRFNRPRVEQIKSAMLSICCKERVKIPADALTQLIVAANQDVRQTLNLLSMWAVEPALADSERLMRDAGSGKKDIKLGPWEAVRKVFSAEEHKTMSINDKSDLFFYDYSLAPLFVQENYLHVAPHCPKNELLTRVANASDSISIGDLVDARIRGSQAWNLLPMQAMYSSVIPGTELSGHVAGQINFPGWLGNNSKRNKMHRLCQEVHAHTRLSTSGSKSSIFLDYAPHLRDAILTPLLKEKSDGIEKSLEILESYHLLREDLDSLVDLSLWPGQRNPMILIDSKIKAAMTRTYNKKALALPYAPGAVKKGRSNDAEDEDEDNPAEDEPEDSDPEHDALIKKKKPKEEKPALSKERSSKNMDAPSTSKAGSSKDKSNARKKK